MSGTALALHVTVAGSVLAGVPVTWRAVGGRPTGRRVVGPGWWLAAVTGLLVVNQVLFTVYALRVHGGDMSYLGGYVPQGWFELADLHWLADRWPAPELLALCALRIPSLLELPFGILGYLTIANWLDPLLYRRLTTTPVLALTSASYTITFGLIEWAMHTSYVEEDLVLRAISGVLTVVALRRVARQPSTSSQAGVPRSASELLAFAASTAALGFLILALYDSVLLYSMGKAGQHLIGGTLAGIVLVASRIAAVRLRATTVTPPGPGLATLTSGLFWWLALFVVPALAIRYELGFGSALFAAAAGLLVIGAATIAAFFQVYGRLPRPAVARWLLGLAVAVVAGAIVAAAGLAVPAAHSEIRLLWGAALFVLVATAVTAAWDRRYPAGESGAGARPVLERLP